jgi:hypothetical protein
VQKLPQLEDWDRFDYYGKLVRRIDYHFGDEPEDAFWPSWAQVLLQRLDLGLPRQLLPSLQTLVWGCKGSDAITSGLCYFLSNTLKTFHVLLGDDDATLNLATLAENIERVSPNITDLKISLPESCITSDSISTITFDIVRLLKALPALEKMVVDLELFYRCLSHSPMLPKLKSVKLLMAEKMSLGSFFTNDPDRLHQCRADMFPALRDIEGPIIRFWILFLRHCGSNLEKIVINQLYSGNIHVQTPSDLGVLCGTIAQFCHSLLVVKLDYLHLSGTTLDLAGIHNPLLQCSHLRDLAISLKTDDFCSTLSDDCVLGMAKAWPSLEQLVLGGPYVNIRKPASMSSLSLDAIISLGEHCVALRILRISVHTSVTKMHEIRSRKLKSRLKLDRVDFRNSSIPHPARLALWLVDTFIGSTDITWTNWTDDVVRTQMWKDTKAFAHKIRSERRGVRDKDARIKALEAENAKLKKALKQFVGE